MVLEKHQFPAPNLIDFQNWQLVSSGNWQSIEANEDKLYAINSNQKNISSYRELSK